MSIETGAYDTITMVDRAVQIMNEIFLSEEPIGVSEIAQNLDLPKATVYRILNTLCQKNIIIKDPDSDKYELGLIFIEFGEKVKSKLSLKTISEPLMEKLSKSIGESVNLGILHERDVLSICSIEGESSVLISKLIPISPLHCSSMGKILLSEMDDNKIREYFKSNRIQKRTINTIIDYDTFIIEREKILKEKFSFDREEYEYGLTCISCPITNKDGIVVAALSISGPTSRLQYKGLDNIMKELKNSAVQISEQVKTAML